MKSPDPKVIKYPIFNPRILAGARISETTIDELSFITGLNAGDWIRKLA